MGELLGLLSGLFFGLNSVSGKVALKTGATASQTTLMTLLVAVPAFSLLLLLPGQLPAAGHLWNWHAIGWFSLSGVISSLIARVMYFRGLALIGPSRLTQLVATDSVFAVMVAGLLVHERLSTLHLAGIGLITVSVFLIGSEKGPAGDRKARLEGVMMGLGSAALFAFRNTFVRMGLELVPAPAWGAAVGNAASLLVYLIYMQVTDGIRSGLPSTGGALRSTLLVGACNFGAWLTMFYALSSTQVAVATALKNTAPFFAMAFAWLFIRGDERITVRLVASCTLMAAGLLISL